MQRIIGYRNSFLPHVHGVIVPQGKGAAIKIKMRMPWFVMVFMAFWISGVCFGAIASIYAVAAGGISDVWIALVPLGMMLFAWALTYGGFWFEANKQRAKLVEIFAAN